MRYYRHYKIGTTSPLQIRKLRYREVKGEYKNDTRVIQENSERDLVWGV